jgi:hypothetical protein
MTSCRTIQFVSLRLRDEALLQLKSYALGAPRAFSMSSYVHKGMTQHSHIHKRGGRLLGRIRSRRGLTLQSELGFGVVNRVGAARRC